MKRPGGPQVSIGALLLSFLVLAAGLFDPVRTEPATGTEPKSDWHGLTSFLHSSLYLDSAYAELYE